MKRRYMAFSKFIVLYEALYAHIIEARSYENEFYAIFKDLWLWFALLFQSTSEIVVLQLVAVSVDIGLYVTWRKTL